MEQDHKETVTKKTSAMDNTTLVHFRAVEPAGADQWMKLYYLPVAYSLIFSVGLVGNLLAITLYLTKLRPLKSSSILMVNLAVTDLLYVLSLPFLVYYYHNGDSWVFGAFMCSFVRIGFYLNLYGSILGLTCLTIFRYAVVARPLLAMVVQQRAWGVAACSAIWALTAVETLPMLLWLETNRTSCVDFANSEPVHTVRVYSLTLTVTGFVLPLLVVSVCYVGIIKRLASRPNISIQCRMKAQRVSMLILVVFVFCFLPYHILRIVYIELRIYPDAFGATRSLAHTAYIVSRPLAGFNTFFNLVFYTLSGGKFRNAFLTALHRCWPLAKARSLANVAIIHKEVPEPPNQQPQTQPGESP